MGLGRYLLTRVLLVIPTLFGVTVVTFVLTYLLPGNPALVKAGPLATPEHIQEMERRMGLDRPVLEDFGQRVPATLELTLASMVIAIALGIPLGVLAAVRRDGPVDHLSRLLGVGGVAMPTFWTGLLAVYVFFYHLGWAPPPLGRLSPGVTAPPAVTGLYTVDALLAGNPRALASALHQLMLPALTLGFSVMAPVTRMVRATMLEILASDYIKAAWAAGLPRRTVVYGDALRNCLIPVITLIGVVFGFLMAGNVVVEIVFAWPGIGNYAVTSLLTKDAAPIQGFVLFVAVVYVLINFTVDLVYGVVDPRIRLR
jgi:peptide/nickel transport system permease protein